MDSSTLVKENINKGFIEKANELLRDKFVLNIKIIQGEKIGRELGFPTANAKYPENIIKLPYGAFGGLK